MVSITLSILIDNVIWHLIFLLFLIRTTQWPDIQNFLVAVLRATVNISIIGPNIKALILDP